MKKNGIKLIFMIIICGLSIWIFSNSSNAAYVSIKPSTTSASPGQTVTLTISSDCVGRVNLTASNGSLSSDRVWIENNNATATITVGNSGTTVITATAQNGAMSSGGSDVPVSPSSASISIKTASTTTNNGAVANNTTTTNQEPNKKSSNANLSNLGIKPNDFTGFKAGTTSYNVTVPSDVEAVEVYATAQDSKSKIAGTGKKQLQEGENKLEVTVTAEDGTKKTYTINVTKSGKTENTEENEETEENKENEETKESSKGLSELKIENLELTPKFQTDIYEYTLKYVGTETTLDINAIATDVNYIVEITGNKDLQEGENIITILVSDAEENTIATYQIKVNKSIAEETEMQEEEQNINENQKQNKIIIIGAIIFIIIISFIIFIIVRHRRNKRWEEEYSMPFSDVDDDKNQLEDYDENMKMIDTEEDTSEEDEDISEENDKEELKKEFLNNYNSNDEYEDWEKEKTKRKRHKGKRFK